MAASQLAPDRPMARRSTLKPFRLSRGGMKDRTMPALLAITCCVVASAALGVLWVLDLPPFIVRPNGSAVNVNGARGPAKQVYSK